MKKQLLVTGIFFLLIFKLQAQEDDTFIKNKTAFGVKGGYNYSYLFKTNNLNLSDSNVYIGLFSETRLSEKWSFQSELLYSTSSGHRFIEVPLLLKYHLSKKWVLFAGPSLNFSMNNRNINNIGVEPLGLYGVIGTQYNISKRFFIEATANLAITNQLYSPFNDPTVSSIFRNTFRIGIGYRF